MNANFRLSAQFGVAAIIGLVLGCFVFFISRFFQPPPEYPMQIVRPADIPALIVLFIAMALGFMTACLAIAGVIQTLLNRGSIKPAEPGAAPNGGPLEQSGSSGASGGPPSVT